MKTATTLSFRLCLRSLLLLGSAVQAQTDLNYQVPPKAIVDLVDVKPTPMVELSPKDKTGKQWVVIEAISGLPSMGDMAQPELRLAGLRFNPKTNGPSRGRYFTALSLKLLPDGPERPVQGITANAKIRFTGWAPDARHFYFVNSSDDSKDTGLSLWIVDVATAQAHRLPGVSLNGIFGSPCEWLSNSESLICKTVPKIRGPAPKRSEVPTGPVVQENLGRETPGPTYEDLLKNPEDEKIFDYYATSQLEIVSVARTGENPTKAVGEPGIIESASSSPDGRNILVDERHHPYSYLLPYPMFPERIKIVNLVTRASKQLVDKPLEDTIPNIHDAVAPGPRDFEWRSDAPATVFWVEAGDGGDPRRDVATRDTLFLLDAPFESSARKLAELPVRFHSITWGTDRIALVEERRWKDRKRIMLAVAPGAGTPAVTLFEGSFEDRYHDPGEPFTTMNPSGKDVLQANPDGSGIYLHSRGASPEGDEPFVAVISVTNGESSHLWQSEPKFFESSIAVLDASTPTLIITRESPELNPNYYIKAVGKGDLKQVTFFPSPYGSAPLPRKQVLKYKRADGVDLSANLYLPPGYKPGDGPLPTLMEAYPTEYKTRTAAGQMQGSPYAFPILSWGSPVPFVTQGYAVLENATIPIIGEGRAEPNDTYVEQLVAGAQAAIDEGVGLGVVDRNRVCVMGHSYGAFMTVNLLAHSDLFKAGIARSGAYNRTLTPFGFQNEERTYWQAPEVYYKMSPFSYADKIKMPLLLIHGEADNNTGTFPVQSERLFSAIKGHGGTVRFVLLPLESHGYAGKQSVLHMFWEMNEWMNKYVKNPPQTTATAK
jgi:dipeptidyl aminopeptidase/acylaminoacyl peptidase